MRQPAARDFDPARIIGYSPYLVETIQLRAIAKFAALLHARR
jgi:hypothetical protein